MSPGEVTRLLAEVRNGDQSALERLAPLVEGELHRLAAGYMRRERPDHTLQATALVNEAYLKLVEQRETNWQNRSHFFAIAASLMRRILVDHARKGGAGKRGGGQRPLPLDEALVLGCERNDALMALDEALERLQKFDARQVRILELRFFGGLSVDETAEALDISPRTVDREWKLAQAWLRKELLRKELVRRELA